MNRRRPPPPPVGRTRATRRSRPDVDDDGRSVGRCRGGARAETRQLFSAAHGRRQIRAPPPRRYVRTRQTVHRLTCNRLRRRRRRSAPEPAAAAVVPGARAAVVTTGTAAAIESGTGQASIAAARDNVLVVDGWMEGRRGARSLNRMTLPAAVTVTHARRGDRGLSSGRPCGNGEHGTPAYASVTPRPRVLVRYRNSRLCDGARRGGGPGFSVGRRTPQKYIDRWRRRP